ncbi:4-alpha-glucanotransferase [Pseudomonas borbori]
MSDGALAKLAQAAGLSIEWVDADGRQQQVDAHAQGALLEALGYAVQSPQQIADSLAHLQDQERNAALPPLITVDEGHTLSLAEYFQANSPFLLTCENGERIDGRLDHAGRLPAFHCCGYQQLLIGNQHLTLAVAPAACPSVEQLTGRKHIWGLTAQLYSLRRENDGGLGDTLALEQLARSAARKGADALGISPTHAMFGAGTENYSPYSPSSRLFFNALHAAPASVLGDEAVAAAIGACGLRDELARLESLSLIDWSGVATARLKILRALYGGFSAASPRLQEDFQQFRAQGGDALLQHCRFEALHGHLLGESMSGDWRNWPQAYRDPASEAVVQFAERHQREVDFHAFCQWLAARCLGRTQHAAREAGMKIGLIADLAVGADGAGSQTWARQDEFLHSVTVGAPPDILNRSGQNWGLSAFSPSGLKRHGYRAFIEMLQANLAHAGGLRIDHIMGLRRLWIIPRDNDSGAGAYLNYPVTELLRLLALEASRARALIIGEDLGTVPDGLREELAQRRILGMRVLQFEQSGHGFTPPAAWPRDALATTTTHDLPTMRGWLSGRDIEWRQAVGHRSDENSNGDRQQRQHDKADLKKALQTHGQLDESGNDLEQQLDACVGYIASTSAPLVLLPVEDALSEEEQPNLPGPGDQHPNWRRRWVLPAAQMLDAPQADQRLQRMEQTRRRAEERNND